MTQAKQYCCYCGDKITKKHIEDKMRDFCNSCNTVFYENPLPIASTILVNEKREVLLVKRKNQPYKDMWCLPIGFAESGEEVSEAAIRELKEEAGVDGEIIKLIDVDTEDNYFYGSLAIVTYEVKIIGGKVEAGDDASDAGFFPIREIPKLAWKSNEKAIKIYIENYKDIWAMHDSFKTLLPEISSSENFTYHDKNKKILSDVLMKIIDRDIDLICENWKLEVIKNITGSEKNMDILFQLNKNILKGIEYWLQRETDTLGVEEFIESGIHLRFQGILLPDVLKVLALSRKNLWLHVVSENIFSSPLEIYTALEINNRIIFFYDKIIYYLTVGYFK